MEEWRWAKAADLGRQIAAGKIDPVDLCETYLSAIDAHPLRDRIYTVVTHDRARKEAKAASDRAKAGQRLSPLDGVPISWKDLFDSAGTKTEAGTRLLEGRVPTSDAEVLRNATSAGLVCLGKTHLSEIAFSGLGYNPMAATPPCVNDENAVPGGSSSGAAASVAFGLAAAGIGSDTGGSVRVPSAWNDLVGLKTTHGRLPLAGTVALCASFDTVGPLCRSVEDAALLLAALEGTKVSDLNASTLNRAKLLVLDTVAMEDVRAAPRAAFRSAVERLEAAGAEVVHAGFDAIRDAFDLAGALYGADAWSAWGDVIERDPSKMFYQIYKRIRPGADVLAADYIKAWRTLGEIRAHFLELISGFDAVIMPTVPSLPPELERLKADDDYYVTENLLALRNTRIGNLMGLCALTLPTGVPSCGIAFNAAPGREAALLRLCAAAEEALS